jgi:hypothetical protein
LISVRASHHRVHPIEDFYDPERKMSTEFSGSELRECPVWAL